MSTETPTPSEHDELTDATDAKQTGGDVEEQPNTVGITKGEEIGRRLLRARLERISEEIIRDAFQQAASRIADGDELTEDDIREMYHAIEEAKQAIELAAEASPETAPFPDLWDFLCEEDRQAYIKEVKHRRDY